MNIETLKQAIGRKVVVRDGKPKPPKHHTRKLADWNSHNFTGTLKEVEYKDYMGYPCATVGMDRYNMPGMISFQSVVPAARIVEILEEGHETAD